MQPPTTPKTPNPRNPMAEKMRRDLERRTDALKSDWAAVEEANIRSLPEGIFVRDFLPLFAGDPLEDAKERLQMWFLIAGTPYIPVNLVNERGEKVLQVPPAMETTPINPRQRSHDRLALGSLMDDAASHGHISPRVAEARALEVLNRRLLQAEVPKTLSPEWQVVIDHYRKPKDKPGAGPAPSAKSDESDFGLDLD